MRICFFLLFLAFAASSNKVSIYNDTSHALFFWLDTDSSSYGILPGVEPTISEKGHLQNKKFGSYKDRFKCFSLHASSKIDISFYTKIPESNIGIAFKRPQTPTVFFFATKTKREKGISPLLTCTLPVSLDGNLRIHEHSSGAFFCTFKTL